jgi:hypothetical protein
MTKVKVPKAIVPGIIGTTAMTAFSYILSENKNRDFREPGLLAGMIDRLTPLNEDEAIKGGWLVHYSVGVFFAAIYKPILETWNIEPTVKNGAIIGGITGLFGAAIWNLTFRLHPLPPRINYRRFYGQLVIAHIIFGTVTILLLQNKTLRNVAATRRTQTIVLGIVHLGYNTLGHPIC